MPWDVSDTRAAAVVFPGLWVLVTGPKVPSAGDHATSILESQLAGGVGPEGMFAMMWGYGWGWGHWLGMGVSMVVFWGLVIVAIVALVRYVGRVRDGSRPTQARGQARPEELLAQRYARGEIDDDEYTRRRELLRASGG